MDETEIYAPVYALVRAIPPGFVATYGQVAGSLTEVSVTARQVGTAMRYAPKDVPWQRVVGAGGKLPIAKLSPELQERQRRLLEGEGVAFRATSDTVDMARHQWRAAEILKNEAQTGSGDLFEADENGRENV